MRELAWVMSQRSAFIAFLCMGLQGGLWEARWTAWCMLGVQDGLVLMSVSRSISMSMPMFTMARGALLKWKRRRRHEESHCLLLPCSSVTKLRAHIAMSLIHPMRAS